MVPPDSRAAFPIPSPLEVLQHMARIPEDRAKMLARIDSYITISEESTINMGHALGLIGAGKVPVLYSNHQSHADKLVLSGIAHGLVRSSHSDHVSGLLVPVAATMETGAQGEYIRQLIPVFAPLYVDRGYGPDVPFITDNDRQQRGTTGSNEQSIRSLMYAPENKFGVLMFPEATLQGGRMSEDGSIHGMQKIIPASGGGLIGYPRFWFSRGLGEAVFLPIGINGSHSMYPPDNEIAPHVLNGILGSEPIEPLVQVTIGKPYTYTDLKTVLQEKPNPKNQVHLDLMMGLLANLLPPAAQGHYRQR